MKKILSLAMILVLVLACAMSAQAAVTEKGVFPIVDEPVTLKVAIPVSSKVEDIKTNQLSLWIQEQTGVTLEFIELSSSDTATQINTMMTSGDLPDIIIGYNFPYDVLCSYADAGLLAPIDEYFEAYGDNVYDVIIDDLGDTTLGYVTYDGHIWAMPSGGALITNLYGSYYYRIQTQFLEELGMEMPHTLDELYDFLSAVKANYPDVIPMTGCSSYTWGIFRPISQAFQYTDNDTYLKVNEDGIVEFVANNELFKEAIEYLKKLIDEGLFDPAAFTQDESVLSTIMAQDGNNVAVLATGNCYTNFMDSTGEEYKWMRIIPNLVGPNGYFSSMDSPAAVRRSMVVTSACEYPDVAFRLFDFLLSDESAVAVRVGFEGEQWEVAEEGVLGRDGQQAWFNLLTTQEWVQPSTNVIWDMENFIHSNIMNHCAASAMSVVYPTSLDIIEFDLDAQNKGEHLPQLLMSADDELEYNELKGLIVGKVNTAIAQFALGDRSMDEFDAFCKELERMDVERYVELAQAAYDSLMGK